MKRDRVPAVGLQGIEPDQEPHIAVAFDLLSGICEGVL